MKENFRIGSLKFDNPFLLAPLAGFTDKSLRTLCEEQGASLTYTEMISGKGLKYGDRKTEMLLELTEFERSSGRTAFQIFGREPEILEFTAKKLASYDNVLLDLNCGCPVPKIVRNGEGSALLKDIDLLHDCVAAMVRGAKAGADGIDSGAEGTTTLAKPVTAKIRMGFKAGDNVAVEAAKAIEAAGAAAITVHGRTREQYYEGKADWQAIADVKSALKIPVIGNGDIKSGEDAVRMMRETGCDAVMIARGALGNPWIFRDALELYNTGNTSDAPSKSERIDMLIRHIELVCEDKGERIGVKEMRKFVGYYTKGMHGATSVRRAVNAVNDKKTMSSTISQLK